MACRICGSSDADAPITLREMMFGTRKEFDYVRCRTCDTLQIAEIPKEMNGYYPEGYYSFTPKTPSFRERIRALIRKPTIPTWATELNPISSVLDIGCGRGELLNQMYTWGFRHLEGYDPFVRTPIRYANGVRVATVKPNAKFDVIMMHHSLEHVPDPKETLMAAVNLLSRNGKIVIRIPVRQGKAWRKYGINWPHYDPPRHFYLWTVNGFKQMTAGIGLSVENFGYDGTLFSFAGGELYSRDIPLQSGISSNLSSFSAGQIAEWATLASNANDAADGDCAWFILSRRSQEPVHNEAKDPLRQPEDDSCGDGNG
jgi:SAM-dependent methyltransferase